MDPRVLHWSARIAWTAVLVGITWRVIRIGDDLKGVYDVFRAAGDVWANRGNPYDPGARYRYPPFATVFFSLNHTPGVVLGSLGWRWLNFAAYCAAIRVALRQGFPAPITPRGQSVLWLLLLPPSFQSLKNGQANGLMCAGMILAALWIAKGRAARAAWALAGPIAFKVYPVALGLCFCVLRPVRFLPALLGALLVVLAMPFASAPADYVLEQYHNLATLLAEEDRTMDPNDAYRDLRLVMHHLGAPLSAGLYLSLQAATGALIAAMGWSGHRLGWSWERTAGFLLTTTSCWMLVFGFSAEQATYMLTTPMLCWGLIHSHQRGHRGVFRLLLATYICYLLPIVLGTYRREPWMRMVLPLGTLIAGSWFGWAAFRDILSRLRRETRRPPAA